MTHDSPRLSRRTLLAGLGTVGLVATGPGVVRALRGQPPYANYTYAQTTEDGPDLRVAWYETYNGEYREDSNRFTDGEKLENTSDSFNESATAERFVDRTGPNQVDAPPVVDLPNVHPGDSGTLVLGLLAENADARVWLRLAAAEFRENRLTEPEIVDADTTDDVFGSDGSLVTGGGELQEYVDVRLWYDTGVLDTGMVVGCNGVYDAAVESLVALPETSASPRADGTLTDLSADAALGEGGGLDFGLLDDGCLPVGRERCLGLEWRVAPDVGNVIQTDSVAFTIEFGVTTCDDTNNPFDDATTPTGGDQ
ncbi:hypothetical protein [Salinirarus marinus]|uniref:hypothetical protein n=1 Tax=Salinirarus marinus TaxID=3068310 RepID=UPI003C6C8D3D